MQAFNADRKHFSKYIDVLRGSINGGETTGGELNLLKKLMLSNYYFETVYTYDKPHPTSPALKHIAQYRFHSQVTTALGPNWAQ
jgi:hypothetical protein